MVERYEFEVDTERAVAEWETEVAANLAARGGPDGGRVRPRSAGPNGQAPLTDERETGFPPVACERCGAAVLVAKFSLQHTSVQWSLESVRTCAEFRARVAAGEPSALIDTCASLRDSIDRAVPKAALRSSRPEPLRPWLRRRGVPQGRADAAVLRRAGRLRVLAVRIRARAGAAPGRTAFLLHPARGVLGAVGSRRGPRRGGLRRARAPAAPRHAAVGLGGRRHGRSRPVRRDPHRRIHPARRRAARLRRTALGRLHPGDPFRPARRTPRPRADRSQRRRGGLRGARPTPARPAPAHPGGLARGDGPARRRPRRPLPSLPVPAAARAPAAACQRPGPAAAVLLAAGCPGRGGHRGRVLPDLLRR